MVGCRYGYDECRRCAKFEPIQPPQQHRVVVVAVVVVVVVVVVAVVVVLYVLIADYMYMQIEHIHSSSQANKRSVVLE